MTHTIIAASGKLMQRIILVVSSILLVLFITVAGHAQPLGEPGDLGPTPSSGNAAVPVDGGASLLALAAAAYAGKRLKQVRKVSSDCVA